MAHYWSIFACESRLPHFNSLARDDPLRISRRSLPLQRMLVLPDGENRTIVASFVSTKHRNVTEDRRTDGSDRGIYRGQHSKLCRRAVKNCHNNASVLKTAKSKLVCFILIRIAFELCIN